MFKKQKSLKNLLITTNADFVRSIKPVYFIAEVGNNFELQRTTCYGYNFDDDEADYLSIDYKTTTVAMYTTLERATEQLALVLSQVNSK